jgi:hypothetical protein
VATEKALRAMKRLRKIEERSKNSKDSSDSDSDSEKEDEGKNKERKEVVKHSSSPPITKSTPGPGSSPSIIPTPSSVTMDFTEDKAMDAIFTTGDEEGYGYNY